MNVVQPLDTDLEQQLVLVEERGVVLAIRLTARERHPVAGVVGEELVPLLEALLVYEPRLVVDELLELGSHRGCGTHDAALAGMSSVMNRAHARYWPRIDTSLNPL